MSFLKKAGKFFHLPNHTPRRIISKAGTLLSRAVRSPRVYGYPSHLMMEISSACQLACPLCPLGNRSLHRESRLMTMEIFQKAIDDIGEYLYHININGMGEPLLNPRVLEMIAHARRHNIYTDLYTNFQCRDRELIRGLVGAGLDSILIALDGATREVYEQYRIKGSFERIIANIKELVHARRQQNSRTPEINIQFVVFDHNREQLDMMQDLVGSLGADNLLIKRPFLFWGTGDAEKNRSYVQGRDGINQYEADRSEVCWQGKRKSLCEVLWASSVILADGSVAPCCFDYDGKILFGNVQESRFRDIWNNRKYRGFRQRILRDWTTVPLCTQDFEGGCPTMYLQPDDWLIELN